MTDLTARLALPLLQPGQAQKELFHNEALAAIDIAIDPAVITSGTDVPPANPSPGACWRVGTAPTGAWAGQAGAIAGSTDGGWRFVQPRAGTTAWVGDEGRWHWHDGTAWQTGAWPTAGVAVDGQQVLSTQAAAIADIGGGTVIDGEARNAIAAILAALRHHGLIAP